MISILRRAAVLAFSVLTLSGCGSSADSPIANEDIAVVDITELPNIDETRAQMTSLIERAGSEVERAVPNTGPWEWRGDETGAPCTQESTGHQGTALYLRRLVSESGLTDDEWGAVLPIVRGIAAESGLTRASSPKGDHGSRDVRFTSNDGRELAFISRATTLFSGKITCRRYGGAPGTTDAP